MRPARSTIKKIKNFGSRKFRLATVPLRRTPDYLIIGAQKSATTTLFEALSQHPQINNPHEKELHYFDRYSQFSHVWYRSQFPLNDGRLTGEASPSYLFYPGVPEHIGRHVPNCKFIVLLREPGDRAYSHFQMCKRRGDEDLTFAGAIEAESARLSDAYKQLEVEPMVYCKDLLRFSYLSRGRYAEQLSRWLEHYPLKQFHVQLFEDFVRDSDAVLGEITKFLGLDDHSGYQVDIANSFDYSPMAPDVRLKLDEYFAPHNADLKNLLKIDLPWKT